MPERGKVVEGWTGPGKYDGLIQALTPGDDGLHIDMRKRGMYEWWYFDAYLDDGSTLVVFFYASNPNPGVQGKSGVEIVLLKSDSRRTQKFYQYPRSSFRAAREKPEVTIGSNTMRVEQADDLLPRYEITLQEQDLACRLEYRAAVDGWRPGNGLTQFGDLGYFAWVIPFARATVTGSLTLGQETIPVAGIGYHDHNWLNFPFQTIIDYWMWGRIYSPRFTVAYAYIQCNQKVDGHVVKVLMLADGRQVVLSTGEFEFSTHDFEYSPAAKYKFPNRIAIKASSLLSVTQNVKRVLEAQDMLESFNPVLRFIGKHILRMKPGYFRLLSDFELEVASDGQSSRETGTTLHEIVLFRPVQ
jgi:predicted secreted hydrolase